MERHPAPVDTTTPRTRLFHDAALAGSFVRAGSVLSGLPPDTIGLLLDGARRRGWTAGQRAWRGDDPPGGLLVVLEGRLGLHHPHDSGRELALETLTAGDLLGETGLAAPAAPLGHDAVAVDEVRAIELAWPAVRDAARFDDRLAELLHGVTIERMHERGRLATSLAFDAVERRTIRVVLDLDRRLGLPESAGGRRIDVELTQSELATMVGASRKAIVDVLRRLRATGLVEHERRCLRLLDPAGLHARA